MEILNTGFAIANIYQERITAMDSWGNAYWKITK